MKKRVNLLTILSACLLILSACSNNSNHVHEWNDGEFINQATFEFDKNDVYLRLTIRDKNGKFANTNAYFLEDLK
jgi:major membrane immunogen (membrane-anchored lipoprotein)